MRAVSRALVREPLVHFVVLGALLFVLDAVTSRDDDGDREVPGGLRVPQGPVVVDGTVRAELIRQWEQTHAAAPDDTELSQLVERWIDEEVMYREGLARALADGDAVVRERIAAQMVYVLSSRIVVPEPTDDELRAAFEQDPSKWAQQGRIDFTQVYVAGQDKASESRARELLGLLQGGAAPEGLGDSFAGGRRFRGRRVAELAERFGAAFVEHIDTQPEGTWVLRRSEVGLHLVRIDRRSAARLPELEDVRDAVRHDWQEARRHAALQQATQELRGRWEIVVSP